MNEEKPASVIESIKKGEIDSEKLTGVLKTGAKISTIFGLVKTIIFILVFASIFIYLMLSKMIPAYIGLGFIAFLILGLILQIIQYRRVKHLNLQTNSDNIKNVSQINNSITVGGDEKISGYVAGIIRTGFGIRGTETLGTGEIHQPENAFIATNKQIIFLVVPLPGADKSVLGTDIGMTEWMLSKKDIETKLQELIATKPLQDIVKTHNRNYAIPLNALKVSFTRPLLSNTINFLFNGKKISYGVRTKEDYEKAKELLTNYL